MNLKSCGCIFASVSFLALGVVIVMVAIKDVNESNEDKKYEAQREETVINKKDELEKLITQARESGETVNELFLGLSFEDTRKDVSQKAIDLYDSGKLHGESYYDFTFGKDLVLSAQVGPYYANNKLNKLVLTFNKEINEQESQKLIFDLLYEKYGKETLFIPEVLYETKIFTETEIDYEGEEVEYEREVKYYNDEYYWIKGNRVIRLTSKTLEYINTSLLENASEQNVKDL